MSNDFTIYSEFLFQRILLSVALILFFIGVLLCWQIYLKRDVDFLGGRGEGRRYLRWKFSHLSALFLLVLPIAAGIELNTKESHKKYFCKYLCDSKIKTEPLQEYESVCPSAWAHENKALTYMRSNDKLNPRIFCFLHTVYPGKDESPLFEKIAHNKSLNQIESYRSIWFSFLKRHYGFFDAVVLFVLFISYSILSIIFWRKSRFGAWRTGKLDYMVMFVCCWILTIGALKYVQIFLLIFLCDMAL